MTVSELREILSEMPDDADVRLACQPSYPFEYSIGGVFHTTEIQDDFAGPDGIVYIGEQTQLGYLPGHASEGLGWK